MQLALFVNGSMEVEWESSAKCIRLPDHHPLAAFEQGVRSPLSKMALKKSAGFARRGKISFVKGAALDLAMAVMDGLS